MYPHIFLGSVKKTRVLSMVVKSHAVESVIIWTKVAIIKAPFVKVRKICGAEGSL